MLDQNRRSLRLLARQFARSESGATAIEYGLLASIIAVSMIGAASTIGTAIENVFNCLGEVVRDSGGTCSWS